ALEGGSPAAGDRGDPGAGAGGTDRGRANHRPGPAQGARDHGLAGGAAARPRDDDRRDHARDGAGGGVLRADDRAAPGPGAGGRSAADGVSGGGSAGDERDQPAAGLPAGAAAGAGATADHRARGVRRAAGEAGAMKFLYQFSARDSFIHRLDPRSKLFFIICFLVASFLIPYPWIMPLIVVAVIWVLGGIGPREYLPFLLFLLPLMLAITLIHLLTDGPPYLTIQ